MHAPLLQTSLPPEEMLSTYFTRLAGLTPHEIRTFGWFAPSGLDALMAPFRDLIGTFEQVSATNTLLPLQTRVMTSEDIGVYLAHCKTKYKGGILALLGMNGQGSGWATPILASCPDCVTVNIAACKTPFWNRKNLVPGLLYCSSHTRPLETACGRCREDFKQNPERCSSPGKHCGCGLRPLYGTSGLSSREEAAEIELHRVSTLLLNVDYRPDIQRDAVSWAASQKASELGLVIDNSPNMERVSELLHEHPMRSLLNRTRVLADKSSVPDLLTGKRVYANPVQTIGLLSLLHGTWANFEEWLTKNPPHREWTDRVHEAVPKPPEATRKDKNRVAKHEDRIFAKICAKYVKERQANPCLVHSEITAKFPKRYGPLFTKARLREAGVDVPDLKRAHRNKDYEKIDASLSSHVHERARLLVEEGFPKAITRTVLTRGHELAGHVGHLKAHLPRTNDALKASVEDRTAWRRRVVGLDVSTPRAQRKQQNREANREAFSFVQPVADVESVQP